ncbi:MAG: transporter [Planctomycetaceae bacterium]|nr:transporter [Planctomycetaceae bacterium]
MLFRPLLISGVLLWAGAASAQTTRLYDDSATTPETASQNPGAAPEKSASRGQPLTSDPVPAQWGNVRAPRSTPTMTPPVNYLLIKPPEGVVQDEYRDEFLQTVGDPAETYHQGPFECPRFDLDRPDGLAPIGVFGDHTLAAGGEFLVSYRYINTIFDGNRDGTSNVSTGSVLNNFAIAPTHMQTQKQIALLEYGVTDDLTLLALLPFWDISLNQMTRGGGSITNSNSDPGDLILEALYVVWRGDRQQVHLNLGLQFPLGVQESERFPPTPDSPDKSYPLRVSSGTYDLMPGATYRGQTDDWTWGVQGIGTIRLGLNNFDYKVGNRFEMTGWLARRLNDYVSLSTRIDGNIWGNLFGADPRLNQLLVPTNRPHLQGGRQIDLLFGMNFYVPGGDYVRAQYFSVEGGLPVYQSLFGPQLKTDWLITAGYNLRF